MTGLWIVACGLMGLVGLVQDQATPTAQPEQTPEQPGDTSDLPSAETLFERYRAALGKPEKMDEIKSVRIDGRYVGRPFNFAARLTIWREYPNKFHLKIQEPAGATIELCFDGETGWERQPGIGLRKIEGLRLIELRDTSDFWGEANYKDRYVDTQVLGRTEFDGQKAIGVHVRALSGREKILLFSEVTGLYLGSRTKTVSPTTGEPADFETVLKPYKEFNEVKMPMGMVQRFKGDEKPTEFDYVKIEVNPKDKHDFSLPPELRDTPGAEPASNPGG